MKSQIRYGCTFNKCTKSFKSCDKRKRHENSKHFQLEQFVCPLYVAAERSSCRSVFYHLASFETHLRDHHGITDPEEAKHQRIGRNRQQSFWCGFCTQIVQLNEKRDKAWNERFDHIKQHYDSGEEQKDYFVLEQGATKGESHPERFKVRRWSADLEKGMWEEPHGAKVCSWRGRRAVQKVALIVAILAVCCWLYNGGARFWCFI